MDEQVKEEITTILGLLRGCLIKNGVSMGVEFKKKEIMFFNTETYLKERRFIGLTVNVDDLVK